MGQLSTKLKKTVPQMTNLRSYRFVAAEVTFKRGKGMLIDA